MSRFTLQSLQNQMHARAVSLVSLFQEETIAFLLGKEFPDVSGTLTISKFGVRIVLDQIENYSAY